ncbi:hypothetical protein WISP_14895 [Willisornis vidua]|uniref:Uncharacterized protein n=1 Tax=Willisornis vidua TaxID=1566151 RepID=A0ABQ9DRI2_9PASS|nr:hypothetical protein WISP_14895 [Willisornis vidua]
MHVHRIITILQGSKELQDASENPVISDAEHWFRLTVFQMSEKTSRVLSIFAQNILFEDVEEIGNAVEKASCHSQRPETNGQKSTIKIWQDHQFPNVNYQDGIELGSNGKLVNSQLTVLAENGSTKNSAEAPPVSVVDIVSKENCHLLVQMNQCKKMELMDIKQICTSMGYSLHRATAAARSLLECGLPMRSQPPSDIHLLKCGVLHRLQVNICSTMDLQGL